MKTLAVIPARFESTRFPGKPLVVLDGKTMIERVWLAATAAQMIDEVIVATDDDRIAEECRRIGARFAITDAALVSGTDRVAAVAQEHPDSQIILNVQGDEPLIPSSLLDDLVQSLSQSTADVCTPITRIQDPSELDNPTICKVTLRRDQTALYFSRSVIPYMRGKVGAERLNHHCYWKHIGIYAYRRSAIERFASLPESPLEAAESLEQLRLLVDGARYLCVETKHTLIAIDTPADVAKVLEALQLDQ